MVGGLDGAAPGRLESVVRERDDLRVEVLAWERRFGDAEAALSAACSQVLAIVDGDRMSTADQLWAIPETVVQQMVVEPLGLAGLLLDDPSQVDDVATAMWFGTIDQLRHPRRTAEEMAGLPAYEDGRWGEGVGTGIASVAGLWSGRRLLIPDEGLGPVIGPPGRTPGGHPQRRRNRTPLSVQDRIRFAANIQDRGAPLPQAQTLDEMAAGVDLSRSEHASRGHTISRHVAVDDDYLLFRLEQGTPLPDGTSDRPATTVSAWTDRRTAEETITRAVRQHQIDLEEWLDSGEPQIEITIWGGELGRTLTTDRQGRIDVRTADLATIRLRRTPDGRPVRAHHDALGGELS